MASASDYTVRPALTAGEIESALKIRMDVFTDEQGFDADVEIDTHDPAAIHFIIYPTSNPKKVVGTVRYNPYPFPNQPDFMKAMFMSGFPQRNGVKSESDIGALFGLAADRNTSDKKCTGAKLGRLCLAKEVRGKKLGEKLVKDSEKYLEQAFRKKKQVDKVAYQASAQVYAVGFYEKLGYKVEGEAYDEDGQPHKMCRKVVKL